MLGSPESYPEVYHNVGHPLIYSTSIWELGAAKDKKKNQVRITPAKKLQYRKRRSPCCGAENEAATCDAGMPYEHI